MDDLSDQAVRYILTLLDLCLVEAQLIVTRQTIQHEDKVDVVELWLGCGWVRGKSESGDTALLASVFGGCWIMPSRLRIRR